VTIRNAALLADAAAKHADLRGALETWRRRVEAARWKQFADLKHDFPSADAPLRNRTIFSIKGNRYRVVVQVAYQLGTVIVLWVGTHPEYDKIDIASLPEAKP
jgi:mRNA interferase HigB